MVLTIFQRLSPSSYFASTSVLWISCNLFFGFNKGVYTRIIKTCKSFILVDLKKIPGILGWPAPWLMIELGCFIEVIAPTSMLFSENPEEPQTDNNPSLGVKLWILEVLRARNAICSTGENWQIYGFIIIIFFINMQLLIFLLIKYQLHV